MLRHLVAAVEALIQFRALFTVDVDVDVEAVLVKQRFVNKYICYCVDRY